ncbi:COX15/CtaA family protein [Ectothiorhodospiraceae bacterium 2226]|nr:COX15/CtaA family protein [Ectothiorhodospiraceae bacterium 2226]
MQNPTFLRLAQFAVVLTLIVVVLGAYVRLSDAGLGCPDWPGCYGYMMVTQAIANEPVATEAFPERPLEADKAWKEMVHRYAAGLLGLTVATMAWLAWRRRRDPGQPLGLPLFLVGLIVFQALLGMWTVTLLLKPAIVMLHLLGGFATLALLWLLVLTQWRLPAVPVAGALRAMAAGALLVLVGQIALGGWTSANYAALACPDFPTCQTEWWPEMDFREAFVPWRGIGVDYEGGILENDARVAIHMTHRLGALLTTFVLALLAFLVLRADSRALRVAGWAMLGLLALQVSLGLANVLLSLPLSIAVAHNGVAALLLLSLVTLNFLMRRRPA